jgi:hypothetical protein
LFIAMRGMPAIGSQRSAASLSTTSRVTLDSSHLSADPGLTFGVMGMAYFSVLYAGAPAELSQSVDSVQWVTPGDPLARDRPGDLRSSCDSPPHQRRAPTQRRLEASIFRELIGL